MSFKTSATMLLMGRWDAAARWAPIPLRLIVGYGFMEHGFAKLARGPEHFATILHAMGVPGPHFMAWITVLVEILGGLAVALGAFVTPASIPMAAIFGLIRRRFGDASSETGGWNALKAPREFITALRGGQ